MDTLVTVRVESYAPASTIAEAISRALAWFEAVERCCSRFDPESELVRLCSQPGRPVPVSAMLFEAIGVALQVASASGGAFDPAVGGAQKARGFDHSYLGGSAVSVEAGPAGFRDVRLDPEARTVELLRPLLLDLGAVAKGMAIDLAVRELVPFERFLVDAGGDLFAGGAARPAKPWRVGVQAPAGDGALLGVLQIWNRAVCTSGGAERRAESGGHHLLDPRSGRAAVEAAGVTTVAGTAMAADALATAAFVLGPEAGLRLLRECDVDGLIVAPAGEVRYTPGWARKYRWNPSSA